MHSQSKVRLGLIIYLYSYNDLRSIHNILKVWPQDLMMHIWHSQHKNLNIKNTLNPYKVYFIMWWTKWNGGASIFPKENSFTF